MVGKISPGSAERAERVGNGHFGCLSDFSSPIFFFRTHFVSDHLSSLLLLQMETNPPEIA